MSNATMPALAASNSQAGTLQLIQPMVNFILPEKPKGRTIKSPWEVASDAEFYSGLKSQELSNIRTLKDYERVIGDSQPIFSGFQFRSVETKERLGVFALEHPSYGRNLLPTWSGESAIVACFGFSEVEQPAKGKAKLFVVPFYFFYSLCDIWYQFASRDLCWNMTRQIVKHRTHKVNPDLKPQYLRTGVYFEIPVADGSDVICELAFDLKDQGGKGQGGLEKVAGGFGLSLPNKGLMDNYKEDMRVAYDSPELHDDCVRYGKGDVPVLFDLADVSYDRFANPNDGVIKRLGLSVVPRPFNTIGGITNQISVMKLAEGMGLLKAEDKEISDEAKHQLLQYLLPGAFDNINDQGGTAPMLGVLDGGYCKNLQPRSVRWHNKLMLDLDLKGCYMEALVHQDYPFGRPIIIKRHRGEQQYPLKTFLNQFESELVPGLWYARISTKVDDKGKPVYLTFDQDLLLSKIFGEKAFEDNDFDQEGNDGDSPDVDTGDLSFSPNSGKQLQGVFMLNTRQLSTAMLTHDSLQALKGCCSKSEWNELMRVLVVDCALFYPKSQEVSVEQFKRKFKPQATVNHQLGSDGTYTRTVLQASTWCRINMGANWCQLFIDFRNINKLMKDACKLQAKGKDTEAIKQKLAVEHDHLPAKAIEEAILSLANHERDRPETSSTEDYFTHLATNYDAGQYAFKITGLAIFGTSGSWHYQSQQQGQGQTANPKSGNFCVANNITARARVGVWAVSKALLTACVITDGGFFDINRIAKWQWRGKRNYQVGLHDLCNLTNEFIERNVLTRNRELDISIQPLGGSEWQLQQVEGDRILISNGTQTLEGRKEKWKALDTIAFEHVKAQFPMLDVFSKGQFKFASKQLYKGACIQSQANYYLVPFDGLTDDKGKLEKPALASRGYKVKRSVYLDPTCSQQKLDKHPYFQQMLQLYEGTQVVPVQRAYTAELTGVNDVNSSEKAFADFQARNILPNEPTPSSSFPRPISLSMFRWQTYEQYKCWNSQHDRLRLATGWGVEGYFPFAQLTDTFETISEGVEVKLMLSVDYDRAVRTIQDAIDKGHMWLDGSDPRKGGKGKSKPNHSVFHPQMVHDLRTYDF